MSFVKELQRRNVFRVGVAYLALSWLLIEVGDTLFPMFGIPDWGLRFLVVMLSLGFLPTLVISWIYELTPEGIKRDKDVKREASITRETARRLDLFTIGLIVVALLIIVADRFWLNPVRDLQVADPVTEAQETVAPPESRAQAALDSIAVLPFANRSINPEDAFFVDGIHDDLLTYISQIESIKTISRTSVMKYRDSVQSIPEIARELGVAVVLEGGVQRAGDQVRINVQLIDAQTDDHIWSNIYDRELTAANLFAIQSEIARTIADALRVNLSPEAQQRIDRVPTENLAALEAYFLGRQAMATRTVADLAKAASKLEIAVELDPDFALAYVGLADTYLLQAAYSRLPWDEMNKASQAASESAIQLDPMLGEAYASLAKKKSWSGDLAGAEEAFKRAIELSPNYAPAYQWYGEILGLIPERIDEALELTRQAVGLDPMSAIIINDHGEVLEEAGMTEEALARYERAIELEPRFSHGYFRIGRLEIAMNGRFDEALSLYKKAYEIDPEAAETAAEISKAYLNLTDTAQADEWRRRIHELTDANDWLAVAADAELLMFQGKFPQAMEFVQSLNNWEPDFYWPLMRLGHHEIAMGRAADMIPRFERGHPELFGEDPVVNGSNLFAAVDLALTLKESGSTENAERLLDLSLERLSTFPERGRHRRGPLEARILVLQGRKNQALAALRRAVDRGWRLDWWYHLEHDPALKPLHDDPRFQALKSEIVADIESQLARVRQ